MDSFWNIDTMESKIDTNRALYPHQKESVNALKNYFKISADKITRHNRGLLIMPTGSGKTFTAVHWLLTDAMANGYKVIWLVHRRELIDQTTSEFKSRSPIMSVFKILKVKGIAISSQHCPISSARGFDINIGSSLSIGSRNGLKYLRSALLGKQGKEKLIVVIDEAHHAISNTNLKILKKIEKINPNYLLLGLTATPTRISEQEKARLSKLFNVESNRNNEIGTSRGYIYECKLKDLIVDGFLAKPIYIPVETKLNAEVDFDFNDEQREWLIRHGELSDYVINKVASSTWRNQIIVEEYINKRNKYGKTLIFAVNQLHAITLADLFKKQGVDCRYCISNEPESRSNIDAFKNNEFPVLINVQMMTEGSDVPDIQSVFLTRATQSDSLLMQMIGRGLRGPSACGTEQAFIVDFHDNWGKYHGWLDPKVLLNNELEGLEEEIIPEEPVQEELIIKIPKQENIDREVFDLFKLMLEVNDAMTVDAFVFNQRAVIPYGWFSIQNGTGEDRVMIYETEIDGYDAIAKEAKGISIEKPLIEDLTNRYFDTESIMPDKDALQVVLDELYKNGEMPSFFTFKDRDVIDINYLADQMIREGIRLNEINSYAEKLFEQKPILKSLHHEVDLFSNRLRSALLKSLNGPICEKIEIIDERAEYCIMDDYYNLEKMMEEILSQFSDKEEFIGKNPNITIRWSKKPLRSYFGLCKKASDGEEYSIIMNIILSSPLVSEDVVASVLHHELLHAYGFWNHDQIFRKYEWKYKNKDLMNIELDTLFQLFKLDELAPSRPRRKYLEKSE